MDLGLSDRVYVVTEAAHGLGRAYAEQLAAEGARLVLCGADERALTLVAARLGGAERALAVTGDLTDPGLETCLVAAAIARYGRLDGALIGIPAAPAGNAGAADDGAWRLALETGFLSPLRLARTTARHVSHEGGSIVLTLDEATARPGDGRKAERAGGGGDEPDGDTTDGPADGHVHAQVLRPALAAAVRALAQDLGPRNIRVNALVPGTQENGTFLRRRGEPLEFARPAVFLLSPACSYLTGTMLTVDGGA